MIVMGRSRGFQRFWKERELRVRVLVLANIRMSQDAEGPRRDTVEGFEDSRQQSKQGELGRGRRHGERRSECAGGWTCVVESCDSCLDLSARKVNGKLRDVLFWCTDPGMAETFEIAMEVSETNDMSHDMILPCCDEGTKVCAYHEGWRSKSELEPNKVVELPVDD